MRRLRLLFRDWFRRDRFEQEMREEIDTYLAMSADGHMKDGQSEASAMRTARMEIGGVEQARERLRAERNGVFFETLWQDVRFALRQMRRQPGFTLVAVLTLALGIGANTAVISVVRSVLLAPLPFEDSDRLVRLVLIRTDGSGRERRGSLEPSYFSAVRERSQLLERVAAQRFQNLTITEGGHPERVLATGVSDQWAETLGVRPQIGRSFSAEEQREGTDARVAIIGHGLWQRRFGGDASVLGRTIRLGAGTYTVIGVMPAQFRYPYESELWFPHSIPAAGRSPDDLNAPARLRPGVTHAQLDAELASIAASVASELPAGIRGARLAGVPMRDEFARDPNQAIVALAAAVGFVLLLACVNLAMLLVARGGSRAHEFALRTAIGAGRLRQIRQLLTETTLLALIGGIGGVLIAVSVSRWLGMLIPARLSEVIQQVRVDGAVLSATVVLCVLTGLLFGILPALRLTKRTPSDVLRDGGRAGAASGRRLLDLLVAGEAALAVLLLVSAALMTQNFARLLAADVGYDPFRLVRINLGLSDAPYADPRRRTILLNRILERVETLPGVAAAGVTSVQPIPRTRANFGASLEPDTAIDPASPLPVVNRRLVTPGYFRAMGVRLLAGRGFNVRDTPSSEPVVVLNHAAAERFWPGQDPINRRVRLGPRGQAGPWHLVVGVASNMAEPDSATMGETVYQSYAQANHTLPPGIWVTTSVSMLVRATGDQAAVVDAVRTAVREVDPALPLFDITSMDAALAQPLSAERLGAALFVLFGSFGLILAVLGTSGVVGFSVSRRVPEFGLRLALGADPSSLRRAVMRDGLRLVAMGLIAGLLGSWLMAPLLGRVLTEVDPRDPITLAGVAVTLLLAAGAACRGPAVRATRVSPLVALRHE